MSVTVPSSEATPSEQPLPTIKGDKLLQTTFWQQTLEATSVRPDAQYLHHDAHMGGVNHFLLMLQWAFSGHKSIVLSPDHIWLLVCQGIAEHAKYTKEVLDSYFANPNQKTTIQICRNDFVRGRINPWEEVFPAFSEGVTQVMGNEIYEKFSLRFSTSTPTTAAAFEIAFLDTVSRYFTYEFLTLCGIPEIKLVGEKADYLRIRESLPYFRKFQLDWWIDGLIPIIDHFIDAFDGKQDFTFWSSIFKQNDTSGGPYLTGWITRFFPYIKKSILKEEDGSLDFAAYGIREEKIVYRFDEQKITEDLIKVDVMLRNPILENSRIATLKLDNFSAGISKVEFVWKYLDQTFPMYFQAGFIGIREAEGYLHSDIHWAVTHQ